MNPRVRQDNRPLAAASDLLKGQRGAVLVMATIGMLAIIGIVGLALDFGRVFVDNTRLQNALDAAALSGAKTLNGGANVMDSSNDAIATFNRHLESDLADANLVPTIEFSETLVPFAPGAVEPDARYVRARIDSFPVPTSLTRVLAGVGDNIAIAGSAVAGPIPVGNSNEGETCDLAPILACGDPGDTDCSNGDCFGYSLDGDPIELKTHSGNSNDWEVGPGNFQLVELSCGSGGSCVREELAGGHSGCIDNSDPTITTKPGNTVGPTAQGFNTRFGIYQGAGMNPNDYPPDVVTASGTHADYLSAVAAENFDYLPRPDGLGVPDRRILAVPIGDCTGTTNGRGEVPRLGIGCFFMTQPTSHAGNTQTIFGQFIGECTASGDVAENPGGGPAATLYKIVLYKDPDRDAS